MILRVWMGIEYVFIFEKKWSSFVTKNAWLKTKTTLIYSFKINTFLINIKFLDYIYCLNPKIRAYFNFRMGINFKSNKILFFFPKSDLLEKCYNLALTIQLQQLYNIDNLITQRENNCILKTKELNGFKKRVQIFIIRNLVN